MKHKNKKKSLLALATSIAPTGIVLVTKGQPIAGGVLIAMSVGLMLAYDHFDDKAKGEPTLPAGVDEELLESIAFMSADTITSLVDEYNSDTTSSDSTNDSGKKK